MVVYLHLEEFDLFSALLYIINLVHWGGGVNFNNLQSIQPAGAIQVVSANLICLALLIMLLRIK